MHQVSTRTCMCVCMYVCMYEVFHHHNNWRGRCDVNAPSKYMHMYVCMCVYMYVCMYVCMCEAFHDHNTWTGRCDVNAPNKYTHMYVYMCVCIYVYKNIHTYTGLIVGMKAGDIMCTCIHTYIHTYMHTQASLWESKQAT